MSSRPSPIVRVFKPSLRERLRLVLPELQNQAFSVEASKLQAKAGSLNQATRLTVRRAGGADIECVEKTIFRFPGFRPVEIAIHEELPALEAAEILRQPVLLGRIETPLAGIFHTRLVHDEGLNLREVSGEVARGIAEIEHLSHAHVAKRQDKAFVWQLDFFQPWFLPRPRYNVRLALWKLDRLAKRHPQADTLARRFHATIPALAGFESALREAPRCFSHLDYLRKNLMRSGGRLHLLDWGEARVGRIGFDAGAYLHALLRGTRPRRFLAEKKKFLTCYFDALDPRFRTDLTARAVTYLFTVRSLGYLLRRRVVREALEKDALDLLFQRIACIADALETEGWGRPACRSGK